MTEALIKYIEAAAAMAPVWGLLIIFVLMTVESSFIPFPSEVVMIPAGFLAARSGLTLASPFADATLAVLAGVAGSLAGAYVNYFLSLKLGKPFLERFGKYFFLSRDSLERAEEVFREYGAGATFVCRLLPAIRQLISIPAGIANMPLGSFTLWTALGAGIWVIILTGVGYSLGLKSAAMSYAEIVHVGKDTLRHNLHWVLLFCGVAFAAYVYVHKRVMRRSSSSVEPKLSES